MSRRSRRFRPVQVQVPIKPKTEYLLFRLIPVVFLVIAYLNVAAGSLFYPLDFDLGWHLKYGLDVVENHFISSVNTYSVELPGYYWRNSSWLSDVLRFLLFKYFFFQGLMIAGIVTMLLTFFFYAKAAKLKYFSAALVFPLVTFLEIPLTSASFRAQLISLTGVGAIMWILSAYQNGNKRVLFWLVPLYLIWSNLHGGFILGTGYLFAWTGLYIFQLVFLEKSIKLWEAIRTHGLRLGLFIAAATLVTFINPWGIELYRDHLSFLNPGNPSQYLVEWKPLYINSGLLQNHVLFGIFYVISCFIIIWKKRHIHLFPILVSVTMLYIAAFFSRRFAWTMYLMSIPILGEATKLIMPKNKIIAGTIAAIVSLVFLVYIWTQNLVALQFFKTDWNLYCQLTGCSPRSAEFIINNDLQNTKMYTTYDWGGWLIWNYPQIKPLVDGRMSTWVDEKGYNAFLHYVYYENNWEDINNSPYEVVYLSPGKRALFNRLLELVKEGKWSIAYNDNYAFVFVRNK